MKNKIRELIKESLEKYYNFLYEYDDDSYEDEDIKNLSIVDYDDDDDQEEDVEDGLDAKILAIVDRITNDDYGQELIKTMSKLEKLKHPSFKLITNELVRLYQYDEIYKQPIYNFFYAYYTRNEFLNMVSTSPAFSYSLISTDSINKKEMVVNDISGGVGRAKGQLFHSLEKYKDEGSTFTGFLVYGLKLRSKTALSKSFKSTSIDAPLGGDEEGGKRTYADKLADASSSSEDDITPSFDNAQLKKIQDALMSSKGKPTPHRWEVFKGRFLEKKKFFNMISDTEDWMGVNFYGAGKSYFMQYILLPYFAQKGVVQEDVLSAFKLKGSKNRIDGISDINKYNLLKQTAKDDPSAIKLIEFMGEDKSLGRWSVVLSPLIEKMTPYKSGGLKKSGAYEGSSKTISSMEDIGKMIELGFSRPAYADIVNQLKKIGISTSQLSIKKHTPKGINESHDSGGWFHEFDEDEFIGEGEDVDLYSKENAVGINESVFDRWKLLSGIK